MWASIRTGEWLDETRLRNYSLIFLIFNTLIVMGLLLTAHGRLDALGRPLGADFGQVWVAGLESLRGDAANAFDILRHIDELKKEFGVDDYHHIWAYPPFFLGVAAILAKLPYLEALAVWQISTLMLYLAAIVKILRVSGRELAICIAAALAFPALQVNMLHGQTGFLTAGLIGFGFAFLETNPILAGVCFGLLTYKPQLGLVLPVVLIAGNRWRAIIAAVATLSVLILGSLLTVGPEVWSGFFRNVAALRVFALDQDGVGYAKLQSVYAAVRLLGGDASSAYLVQGVATLAALAALIWLWRSNVDWRLKASGAIVGTLLTSPYCFDYDMVVLGPAMALLVAQGIENGFAPYEKTILAAAFVAPLISRPIATFAAVPIGCVISVLLFGLIIRMAKMAGDPVRSPSC